MKSSTVTMEINDLNIPPTEEPFGKKLSRVASQFVIPVLLPLSSIFFGWLYERRISVQLGQLRKEKEQIANLKQDVESLRAEVDVLTKQRDISAENPGVTTIKRRRLLEEAILKEETEATQAILTDLEKFRPDLRKRQDIYCSHLVHRRHRQKVEADLKSMAYAKPYDKDLRLYKGMQDILQNDKSCGLETSSCGPETKGRESNGCLMWVYMDFWKTQAELLKHKRVAERMKGIDDSFTQ